MKSSKHTKETDAWAALDGRQKSGLVRTLHWFHFRRPQLARSWRKEEVITWELLTALQILPRSFFLGELLKRIAQQATESENVCAYLLDPLGDLEIEEYPTLGLEGKWRNRRSDIGIRHENGARLWLEIKTRPTSSDELLTQLQDQRDALSNLCEDNLHGVVALLPETHSALKWPMIRWSAIVDTLDESVHLLSEGIEPEISRGYLKMATELRDRIDLHREPRLIK